MNRSLGFTLIEIVISITVIMLIASITFAGYSKFTQKQKLVTAGQTMKNILRDVQSRAYTGEIDCSVCSCDGSSSKTLSGWYIDFSTREMYGQCGDTEFSRQPITLPPDVNITPYLTQGDKLFFRSFPPGVENNATICISHKDLDDSYYGVTVKQSGDISDSSGIADSCP